jgi:hypothetical protein
VLDGDTAYLLLARDDLPPEVADSIRDLSAARRIDSTVAPRRAPQQAACSLLDSVEIRPKKGAHS